MSRERTIEFAPEELSRIRRMDRARRARRMRRVRGLFLAVVSDWKTGAYTGLTAGKGDCFTYYAVSRALLTALGIDNLEVERAGGETRHFWNLVNCGDGWYHFDACLRSSKLPPFLSFMFTDQQAADFTAEAGRNYHDFDGSLLPERATEIITGN